MKDFLKGKGLFMGILIVFIGACVAAPLHSHPLAIGFGVVGATITVYSAVANGVFSSK